MDKKLLDILACPICKGKVFYVRQHHELACKIDRIAYPVRDNVAIMLESEGRTLTVDECKAIK